ncbi:regulator of nonsense transcripts 3A isoform X2 [Eulemur rufifrons]|uniref:regulator of nonsense transcripts 3A isoform X2 n=1 Tax=Eulemur rufifrons TaxID=859984 RepID=UPI0037428773
MRSQEGVGGPGTAAAARGPSGREKPPALEGQFRHESPRQEPETPPASSSGCGGGVGKHREEKTTALSKVVVRRLPPGLTQEQLEEQLRPLPAHDYFEFFAADLSLHPHLYSRAYINFRNPDDILLFRDRFDGYIFIDSKDPEYKKFLETYYVGEEKAGANPEAVLGELEAKTRELVARRTTPLLEYIKNRKLEKQRIREEKREERRRRELEKKRLREEEKRKRREEERCKRKEADKQKTTEKEIRIKLLKKPEKGEEPTTEKPRGRGGDVACGAGGRETGAVARARPAQSWLEELGAKSQNDSDREHRDTERRSREKEPEAQRCHADARKHRAHCEPGRPPRRTDAELRWGRGPAPDAGRKGGQDGGAPGEAEARPGRGQRCEDSPAPRKEQLGNKERPALQPHQPGAGPRAPEEGRAGQTGAEDPAGAGPAQGEEAE